MKTLRWIRVAALGSALALLLAGCGLFTPNDIEVTVHFSATSDDGVTGSYTFSGEHATALATILRDLDYSEPLCDGIAHCTVDTPYGEGYQIHGDEGGVTFGSKKGNMTAEQTERVLAIVDWARARLPKPTTTTTTTPPTATPPTAHKIEGVPLVNMQDTYPTGCEAAAAVMALRYWDVDITLPRFVANYLPMSNEFSYKDGKRYGPSPYEYFVGDPRKTNSYGCMAPVIAKSVAAVLRDEQRVQDVTGKTMQQLCDQYIAQNIPVLVWATVEMAEPIFTDSWYLPNGTLYTWPTNEHCFVLTGYDEERYYFNDPYTGRARGCKRALAEQRYEQLGSQALVFTQ